MTVSQKWNDITRTLKGKWEGIVSSAKTWGGDLCNSLASGIKGAIDKVTSAAKSIADKIASYLHFSEPDIGPLSNFHIFIPDISKFSLPLIAQGAALSTNREFMWYRQTGAVTHWNELKK